MEQNKERFLYSVNLKTGDYWKTNTNKGLSSVRSAILNITT